MLWINILYGRLPSHVERCRGAPRDIVAALPMLGTWIVNHRVSLGDY